MGSGTPMMPVEEGSTCPASMPTCPAVSAHMASASRSPPGPVQALALPLLTTTRLKDDLVRTRLRSRTVTLGLLMRFLVNRAAAAAGRIGHDQRQVLAAALLDAAGHPGEAEAGHPRRRYCLPWHRL